MSIAVAIPYDTEDERKRLLGQIPASLADKMLLPPAPDVAHAWVDDNQLDAFLRRFPKAYVER